jgi:2-oxoglutarate dehydrogenase E1 component
MPDRSERREQIFDAFRRWGYLEADLDPLGLAPRFSHPDLARFGPEADDARRHYCSTIGADFMHIPDPARRRWIAERLEADEPGADPGRCLERLMQAELFEQALQARYPGSKRFSLEGVAALIPLLDELLEAAIRCCAEQSVLAMSHRGRLNVMALIVGRALHEIFAGFEDVDPRSVLGGGDVKYHLGATGFFRSRSGRQIRLHLVSNPSHLEFVNPVALGRTHAKQMRLGATGTAKVLPILMHGDAAFAGQGINAESLNLMGLRGFDVGGTIHIIVNNQLGFTTPAREQTAAPFVSDVAKRLPIPIFHVNGEDLDAVTRVARWAVDYRYTFGTDVVIDLVGYRRHGHSEVDDPTITQPRMYQRIQSHPPLWQDYARRIGADPESTRAAADRIRADLDRALKEAARLKKIPVLRELPDYWSRFQGGRYSESLEVPTGLSADVLAKLSDALVRTPAGFRVHPKIQKLLDQRRQMGQGKLPVDFAMAEALAFASLLRQGIPVRLTGQDSRRGTFNHRHAVLFDVESEDEFLPLASLAANGAWVEIYNSMLSEAAVLGFEYGFSRDYPEALVCWEAQFGDFANVAQAVIDQFLCAAEDKWALLSGLVLLLPHGYEGQGPEHSSARIERFLQLAAKDNIQVCQPSSAAQYFHLLRRQALRSWRKPLVVFTPKSMLRHPDVASPLDDFSRERFLPVVPDPHVSRAERILLCTGKIGHELRRERTRRNLSSTAVVFLDQLYPFPESALTAELARHPHLRELLWVQEEPANMGALAFMQPRLRRVLGDRIPFRSVKRSASASPATGSAKAHEVEQKTLISLALA